MTTKRYIVPNTNATIATDMMWATGTNVNSKSAYQTQFKGMLSRFSHRGVIDDCGGGNVQIGVVDNDGEIKEGAHVSAALTVKKYLKANQLKNDYPTLYVFWLNATSAYVLGLNGERIVIDSSIDGLDRESQSSETPLDVIDKIAEYLQDEKTVSGEEWSLLSFVAGFDGIKGAQNAPFLTTLQKQAEIAKLEISETPLTLTEIFASDDKRIQSPIRNIQSYGKGGRRNIVIVLVAIMAGGYYWYSSNAAEEERLSQLQREHEAAMLRANALSKDEPIAPQTPSITPLEQFKQEERRLINMEDEWLRIISSIDGGKLLKAAKNLINTQLVEVSGWNLTTVTISTHLDLNTSEITLNGTSHYFRQSNTTTIRKLVEKFPNAVPDTSGNSATISFSKKVAIVSTGNNQVASEKDLTIGLISSLQTATANEHIQNWSLTKANNVRPMPLPTSFIDQNNTLVAKPYPELTPTTWLTPVKRYKTHIVNRFTRTLDTLSEHVDKQNLLVLNGLKYNLKDNSLEVELTTYAKN